MTALQAFHEELLAAALRVDLSPGGARGSDFVRVTGHAGIELSATSLDELIMTILWLPDESRLGLSPTAFLLYAYCSLDAVESDPPVLLSVKQRAAVAAAAGAPPATATIAGAAQVLKDALVMYSSLSLVDPDLLSTGSPSSVPAPIPAAAGSTGRAPPTQAMRLLIPPALVPPQPLTSLCTAGHLELLRFLCPAGNEPPLSTVRWLVVCSRVGLPAHPQPAC